jgi:hypothetical protein
MADQNERIELPGGYSLRRAETGYWWIHTPNGFGIARFHEPPQDGSLDAESFARAMNRPIEECRRLRAEIEYRETVNPAVGLVTRADKLAQELVRISDFLRTGGFDTSPTDGIVEEWEQGKKASNT